ncbi:TonB-dependent receptor [Pseudoxanthomonas winnipegensis]|uniref:TonB-dependent receptor n=1 Tax=Pseudoxanthomonas winnipegensis TaxID=2480810 RepID=UPI0025783FA7|nr:TonB-dependent receptor [Pseudoxanthomonas winnipegensis]WJI15500.1 TonB-dependent receptor [Pseudoxanthomonas winnipegensis]
MSASIHRAGLRPTLLTLAVLAALPAAAQQAPTAATATDLDKVTVKGEKTDRSLQDTASSVAVTTSARIEQENLLSLSDLINRTPNVTPMYGQRGFTIRGIADESGAPNPLATIYLDGAALPSQASDSLPTDLWDLSQVEIFRGPQSTIQGQNALAGAIVMRSEDPTMDWSGRARVLLSDPSDKRYAVAGGGPLVSDELAFRVAAEKRDFDGYVWNPTRQTGEDALESTNARFKLLWTPKGLPGLTARLTWINDNRDGPYMYTYARSDVRDSFDHPINTSDFPNITRSHAQIGTAQVDYDFGNAWTLSSVTAWSKVTTARSADNDLGPVDSAHTLTDGDYRGRSQELRVHYAGERLDGLLGAYWSRAEDGNIQSSRTNVTTPVTTIAGVLRASGFPAANATAIAARYAQALPVIPVDYDSDAPTESENKALFGDGQLRLAPAWTLLGGFRYDRQDYTFSNDTNAVFAGTLPDPGGFGAAGSLLYRAVVGINQAVLGLVRSASGGYVAPTTRSFTAFLPKAGLRWDFAADKSLALTVQRGYRSGGSSFNIARSQVVAYDPEYTWNYEAALRTQWLDGRLTFNANAYYIDWKDKQVTAYFGLNTYDYNTVNAGRAHLYGLEAETRYRVSEGFDLYASLGGTRTRYDEFKTVQGATITDYSGQEFAYAPHWTLAAGGNWRWAQGWFGNLNANFRDSVKFSVGSGAEGAPSRTLVNGKLGYGNLDWSAYVFGSNLLDKGYVQYAWADQPNMVIGAPRVIGIGFEAYW